MRSDDSNSSDDASTSSSDSNNSIRNHNSLIDDEAEESGEESSSRHDSRNGDAAPRPAFPQFMQLPPELRHQIWHLYCPDLSAKARVLQFSVGPSSAILQRPDHYSVKDHFSLADQTESLRVLLSMNSESRSIALRKYPDELVMDAGSGNAIVRFRKETDVVILTDWKSHTNYFLPGFADKVESVSINPTESYREALGIDDEFNFYDGTILKVVPAMKSLFPNLKRLYTLWSGLFQSTNLMEEWCGTDFVHTYMVETHERESGLGEDTKSLFCWPDLDRHADFTNHILRLCSPDKIKDTGLEVWPLVEFESQSGIKMYEKMRRLYLNPHLWPDLNIGDSDDPTTGSPHITLDDSDSDADGTDLNEYESEGIDDEEIIEIEGSSEEDELLQGEPGRFSSPESDDVEVLVEVDTEPVEPVPRSRKRKAIVVDSDDDEDAMEEKGSDDEGDRRQNKRARLTRLVLDSDGEEDGEGDDVQHDQNEIEAISTRRAPKSSRVMLSSSDDQSDNDSDIDEEDTRRAPIALDSDSEEEDDEDEDEDVAPTKFPLAELRRARSENPVSDVSEGDSEQTDEESESEEDQSNDDDDDDEDENDHGLLDTMAGDGTEEEEDEDENEDGW
ncbi:hypothetical protein E4U60_005742 [Claviceps pazoutovae]|uniref:2EXR domain-containing protein n=1 Tax=Claviceps pazoutovae TaxID=1649127 RepID=A0A9P7M7G3_9HYPO|nr:hypothetical protein E4U60_005742 [Claviceps pazoutovae]